MVPDKCFRDFIQIKKIPSLGGISLNSFFVGFYFFLNIDTIKRKNCNSIALPHTKGISVYHVAAIIVMSHQKATLEFS